MKTEFCLSDRCVAPWSSDFPLAFLSRLHSHSHCRFDTPSYPEVRNRKHFDFPSCTCWFGPWTHRVVCIRQLNVRPYITTYQHRSYSECDQKPSNELLLNTQNNENYIDSIEWWVYFFSQSLVRISPLVSQWLTTYAGRRRMQTHKMVLQPSNVITYWYWCSLRADVLCCVYVKANNQYWRARIIINVTAPLFVIHRIRVCTWITVYSFIHQGNGAVCFSQIYHYIKAIQFEKLVNIQFK